MPSLVLRLIGDVETEVVEYKTAKQNYDFEDIGKYFSALSNEANLRGTECGWLLFGITNDREIKGTAYRKEASMPSVGLRRLKHEIAKFTNEGMTFEEIYEFEMEGKRIVAFQIPTGTFATPTTWHGIPWSRENESLVEMPEFKLEAIYGKTVRTGRGNSRSRQTWTTLTLTQYRSPARSTLRSSKRVSPPFAT